MISRYPEAEKKTGALLKVDWTWMSGGFLNLSSRNCTFCHRFMLKGSPMFGTQKQFMVRAQAALDYEPRFSWVTLELLNLFEARWFYFIVKIWPGHNLRVVFNLGWTLTTESRKYLQNQILERERRSLKEYRKQEMAVKFNGGVR